MLAAARHLYQLFGALSVAVHGLCCCGGSWGYYHLSAMVAEARFLARIR